MIPDGSIQKRVNRENLIKLAVFLCIIIAIITIILAVPGLLTSFLLAFVICYLFKPVVTALERRGIQKTFAVLIPFIIVGFGISAASSWLATVFTQQANSFQTDLPKYVNGVSEAVKSRTHTLTMTLAPYTKIDLGERAGNWMQDSATSILHKIPEWISTLLSTMLLAPFFAFFMLKDGQKISRSLLGIVPNNFFEMALNLSSQINKQLGGFIRARLLEALIVGVVVWLGLYSIGFPYTSILALFAGLTNLIPYLGPLIGAAPGVIIAFVNHDNITSVALVSTIYIIAQLIDMLFVIPLVVARIVDLHPVTVVIVIIIGSQIMGILGMIISVPAASILKLVFTEFYNHVVDFRS